MTFLPWQHPLRDAALPRVNRRIETGERLREPPKRDALVECYFCHAAATTYVSKEMPRCARCAERFRRKSE